MLIHKVFVLLPIAVTSAFIASCSSKAELDKLPPDDRKLALEQKTCPETDEPLGSMGVPVKITLKGQTVFLCCSNCQKSAEKDPDKTLKAVADAKAKK